MANPPELWAFIVANTLLFLISSFLAVLSYVAYRQSGGQATYLVTTAGFGFVILGGLVEPVYQLVVAGDYNVSGNELLMLQTGEGILIAFGLGLLYYAIRHHDSGASATVTDTVQGSAREPSWSQQDD